jgi:hypothetical protein
MYSPGTYYLLYFCDILIVGFCNIAEKQFDMNIIYSWYIILFAVFCDTS